MRRRMLRAEIDCEIAAKLGFRHFNSRPLILTLRLLVTGQQVIGAFPRREEIEGAEFLRQTNLVVNDALLLVVVTQLDKTSEWEILAERMPLESIVCENAPEIRVTGEQHAVEVVGLAFVPVSAVIDFDQRRHLRRFVGRYFYADALVKARRQEMVDDVEALLATGPVHRGDVDERNELAGRIGLQESRDLNDVGRLCCNG